MGLLVAATFGVGVFLIVIGLFWDFGGTVADAEARRDDITAA